MNDFHRSNLSSSKVLGKSQYFRAVYALNIMQWIKTTVLWSYAFTLLSIPTSGEKRLSELLMNLIWFVISIDLGTQGLLKKKKKVTTLLEQML